MKSEKQKMQIRGHCQKRHFLPHSIQWFFITKKTFNPAPVGHLQASTGYTDRKFNLLNIFLELRRPLNIERILIMFTKELDNKVNRLRHNDRFAFCLRIIFEIATEGMLVDENIFENWLEEHVRVMGLQQDIHYTFRDQLLMEGRGLDAIYVRGSVGLNMLLRADNEIGAYVRRIMTDDEWDTA